MTIFDWEEPPQQTANPDLLGLPRLYAPRQAAGFLRDAGLASMTECALRTRAYRKQVPFHLNGRQIVFTLSDLREIAEGEACRPVPRAHRTVSGSAPRSARRRRPHGQDQAIASDRWRARTPNCPSRTRTENGHDT